MRSSHSMFGIVVEFHSVACQIFLHHNQKTQSLRR